MVTPKHGPHWKARKPQKALLGTSRSSKILWAKALLAAHQSFGEEQKTANAYPKVPQRKGQNVT